MVRDTISYAGEVILTIYHKGFDNELNQRKIRKSEKIGRYNIVFEEEIVQDNIVDEIVDWDKKIEGFLNTIDIMNPYREKACAFMRQYCYFNKSKKIFLFQHGEYKLNISTGVFNKIILFTKRYTGLDLSTQSMCFGDIFVYENYQVNIRAIGEEGIRIEAENFPLKIIVNFKINDIVVCSKIKTIQEDNKSEMNILSDCSWDNVDVQIYQGNKLIYLNQNISFIQRVVLNMIIAGSDEKIKLNKLGEDLVIQTEAYSSQSNIGMKLKKIENSIANSNFFIMQKLLEDGETNNDFLFIAPNELEKAKNYIVNILRSATDEIWIFDPYFSSPKEKVIPMDWIRILSYCKAPRKNIIFFKKENSTALSVKEFVNDSLEDYVIMRSRIKRNVIGINFYELNTYIHDRFIFVVSDEKILGYTIGTSLNSLHKNYYCINTLDSVSSNNIFNELKKLLDDVNIIDSASI